MDIGPYLRRYFTIFMLLNSLLLGNEKELLTTADVHRIMGQILQKHVDQNKMKDSILRTAFKIYIEQFDPDHIYLLQSEVEPYLNMSNTQLSKIDNQYEQNLFPAFIQLNNTIEMAIKRARIIRQDLYADKDELFYEAETQPQREGPPYNTFANTPEQLRERIHQTLLALVNSEKLRYGASAINKQEDRLIKDFEVNFEAAENPYMYVKEDGKPMSAAAKENIFVLHLLKALASGLDAHTTVYSASEAMNMRVRLEQGVNGTGLVFKDDPELGFVVDKIIKDSSAAKNNSIKLKDQLVKINGQDVTDLTLSEINDLLQGNKGDAVNLTLKRDGNSYQVNLTKQPLTLQNDRVKYASEKYGNGIIGIVQLDSFYASDTGFTADQDVRAAIEQLKKEGNLKGLILDLRKNSGGFLNQAVKVAGLFISKGVIVISKYSNGEEKFYRDLDGKEAYNGPLIILTSRLTASAAEIVAQALQDYGVALVVGDAHTYGKGTIQSQNVTEEGGGSYFKVTVGKYYTVSGKTPQLRGVHADIVVPSQYANENIGEEYLDYSLPQDTITAAFKDPLSDIDPNLKNWYMKYYVPNLQHQVTYWKDMVPSLKRNSEYRIDRNSVYQVYIQGKSRSLPEAMIEDPVLEADIVKPNIPSEDDLQLREAINIAKDMVYLQSQHKEQANQIGEVSTNGVATPK